MANTLAGSKFATFSATAKCATANCPPPPPPPTTPTPHPIPPDPHTHSTPTPHPSHPPHLTPHTLATHPATPPPILFLFRNFRSPSCMACTLWTPRGPWTRRTACSSRTASWWRPGTTGGWAPGRGAHPWRSVQFPVAAPCRRPPCDRSGAPLTPCYCNPEMPPIPKEEATELKPSIASPLGAAGTWQTPSSAAWRSCLRRTTPHTSEGVVGAGQERGVEADQEGGREAGMLTCRKWMLWWVWAGSAA